MAKFYDASMKKMEEACLSAGRKELLSEISGDILEIGSGTGINLSYYPESIKNLVLTEPDPHMFNILKDNIIERYDGKYSVKEFPADALDFPDNSFDAVV